MAIAGNIEQPEARETRRELRRRQVRRRRLTALGIVALLVLAGIGLARVAGGSSTVATVVLSPARVAFPPSPFHTQTPTEIRGVHMTMDLATIPGKLDSYLAMRSQGLNTLELDVKDENGKVGFVTGAPALAREDGAAGAYYDPSAVARKVARRRRLPDRPRRQLRGSRHRRPAPGDGRPSP